MSADCKWVTAYGLRHLESLVSLKGVIVRDFEKAAIGYVVMNKMHSLEQLEWLKLGRPDGKEIGVGQRSVIRSVREGRAIYTHTWGYVHLHSHLPIYTHTYGYAHLIMSDARSTPSDVHS